MLYKLGCSCAPTVSKACTNAITSSRVVSPCVTHALNDFVPLKFRWRNPSTTRLEDSARHRMRVTETCRRLEAQQRERRGVYHLEPARDQLFLQIFGQIDRSLDVLGVTGPSGRGE